MRCMRGSKAGRSRPLEWNRSRILASHVEFESLARSFPHHHRLNRHAQHIAPVSGIIHQYSPQCPSLLATSTPYARYFCSTPECAIQCGRRDISVAGRSQLMGDDEAHIGQGLTLYLETAHA
ncbi:hypothetical protein IG631_18690 [Alternaria alternata]|nr:hypothetical protein IG631_18690 [Alternaria alternata]